MKSFSDVSVIRVAGGYLLMVGTMTASHQPIVASKRKTNIYHNLPLTFSSLTRNISSTAGLRLRDHATVGLRQVPGRRGAGGSAVSGTVGGRGTGFVLPAWPFLQCCHHTGMT